MSKFEDIMAKKRGKGGSPSHPAPTIADDIQAQLNEIGNNSLVACAYCDVIFALHMIDAPAEVWASHKLIGILIDTHLADLRAGKSWNVEKSSEWANDGLPILLEKHADLWRRA